MESTTEYWVWYGTSHCEQARVIAKFDDLKSCQEWCEQEFGDYHEMERSFPVVQFPHKLSEEYDSVMIGEVEDFTE